MREVVADVLHHDLPGDVGRDGHRARACRRRSVRMRMRMRRVRRQSQNENENDKMIFGNVWSFFSQGPALGQNENKNATARKVRIRMRLTLSF